MPDKVTIAALQQMKRDRKKIAGVPPFPDDVPVRVLHRVLNEDPPAPRNHFAAGSSVNFPRVNF